MYYAGFRSVLIKSKKVVADPEDMPPAELTTNSSSDADGIVRVHPVNAES